MKPNQERVVAADDRHDRVTDGPWAELDGALRELPLVPAPAEVAARLTALTGRRGLRPALLRIIPTIVAAAAAVALMITVRSTRTAEPPAVRRATAEAVVALGLIREAFDRVERRAVDDVVDGRLPAAVNDVLRSWPDERRFRQ